MDPLIDRGEYAALAYCTYLNQASLGLIPRTSVEASVRFLTDVAQHGNLRLSDQAEAPRREDVWLSVGNSRYLAHEIPDSQLVELAGVDHDPWVGDSEKVFTAVEAFVAGLGRPYDVAAGS
jgi:hypothetical protein